MLPASYFYGLALLVSLHVLNLLSPGPTMALVIRNSICARTDGIQTVMGVFLSSFSTKILSILGLAVLIQTTPALFSFIQVFGAIYMIGLGIVMLKKAFFPYISPTQEEEQDTQNTRVLKNAFQFSLSPFLSGFLMNTSNPQNIVGFLVIFSTAVDMSMPFFWQLSYVVILAFLSLVFFSLICLFFSTPRVQELLSKRMPFFNALTGGIMIIWGIAVWQVRLAI